MVARFALGLGEAGNFPGGDQGHGRVVSRSASARWRPASSTPAPTSARSSRRWSCRGSRSPWGWYWAFVATGALGFLWLAFWLPLYRRPDEHPQRRRGGAGATSAAILPIRRSQIPWRKLLALPPDLGVRAREVPDRPGLVALPVLDSGLPRTATTASTSRRSARRSSRSISSPTSAASAAAGCRRR